MLVKPHSLFAEALKGGYALGAFNTSNMEVAQAIARAAQATHSPVIIQTSEGAIEYADLPVLAGIITAIAQQTPVPIVLHLDHGKSFETVQRCIEAGYTSVMIDASVEAFEDNIDRTTEVVEYAHARGVWVEAEMGAILGKEGAKSLAGGKTPDDVLTNPKQASEFIERTAVDALAVSVGTIHGAFTGQEYIRFELLDTLQAALPNMPLVLHGASGISAKHLQQAVKTNVCKVNVDTELRQAFEQAVKAYFDRPHDSVDPRDMLGPARDAIQRVVEEKITQLGSAGKALK